MSHVDVGWNWIGEDVALAAHEVLLAEFGGASGVRDVNLLGSALARPRDLTAYGPPDAATLATAHAYGLMRQHPFIDGNKRTGFAVAIVFLLDNDFAFVGTDIEAVETMLAVASGEMTEDALAVWFNDRVQPEP